jgi:Na+/proline symporter
MIAKIDLLIIVAYLLLMIFIGLLMRKRAAKRIESYFLGGRKIPWWILALSGGISNFDITGTMWIISLFYLMGIKAMWVHWMWGVYALPAICMAFMGKWVRRAKVITQAEWIKKRYGEDRWGEIARLVAAVMTILFLIFVMSYLAQGIGKFFSVFLPWSANTCALLIISVVLIYVVLGGFYSVAITDLIQTGLLWGVCIYLVIICLSSGNLGLIVAQPSGWLSIKPQWEVSYLSETPYYLFGFMLIAWIAKGIASSAGGPTDYTFQRYAAAKNPRDASKMGAFWSISLIPRWIMTAAIALLPVIGTVTFTDPEKILPLVLEEYLPLGITGLALAGFMAASMSTLDSVINASSSYAVRDIYQKFINPKASQKRLIIAGYLSSIVVVGIALLINLRLTSIAQIWNWLNLGWGAGIIAPSILGWYWWRFNAKGYIFGMIGGGAAAIIQALLFPAAPLYLSFPIVTGIGFSVAILISFISKPTNSSVLIRFYQSIRPGGFWKSVKKSVKEEPTSFKKENSFSQDVGNACLAMGWISCMYLAPVYFIFQQIKMGSIFLIGTIPLTIILYFSWYKKLPKNSE